MNSIEIIYNQLKDMKENIEYIKKEVEEKDIEMKSIMKEIANTNFNAAEGAKLYMAFQEFLQERRMIKTDLENYQEQFEALGGVSYMIELKNKIENPKTMKKRKISYYRNFPKAHQEKIKSMYHIEKSWQQ